MGIDRGRILPSTLFSYVLVAACFGALAPAQEANLRTMKYTSRSAHAAGQWQREVRIQLLRLLKLDDLVASKTKIALRPRVVRVESKDAYEQREIEINATPQRRIPVLVTFPKRAKGPWPAVVCIHGHGGDRRSVHDKRSIYKGFAAVLAARGYVTISANVGQHKVYEENRTLMGERLWDLIRCVDYLVSMPDVDSKRIGCAGLSLGGEMAMWLGGMDTRIVATLSSGFLTRMDQLEQNHCMCWKFEGLRELVDFADIYALAAPRGLLCQNGAKEPPSQFPPAIAREAMTEIRAAYADTGKPQNVALLVHDGAHEIDLSSLLEFFDRHLVQQAPVTQPAASGESPQTAGATAAKPKRRAKRPVDLLEIPKVGKDQVICFALYTVHDNVLKLTAQLYPLEEGDPPTVRLEVKRDGRWQQVATTQVITPGWTAPLRVDNWDMTQEVPYRVRHGESAVYEGIIRRNPADKDQIVVAAFTGNSIYPGHGGDIPKTDIIENLERIKPDLLFFSGDQVYDHNRHYAYWLRFGRDFGPAIRNTPTVTIPDDHDVGQANLWGAGGKQSFTGAGHDGGYFKPVEYVNEVQRAQTSHLPDPFDPTPIQRGIGVYYTALDWGGISFAIIEDRKFKTGPQGVVPKLGPRPDHVTDPDYDPKALDVPGTVLLGERQLKFLRRWAADWRHAEMKAVLSQTIFCGGAHLHGSRNNRLLADLDSNGWPQTGRNKALAEIRKAFALHIAGDQHLATIIHHGIDDWDDAMYSFCVPSIANLYLRWWAPLQPGQNRQPNMPEYTGRFHDGMANKVTVWAVANPTPEENHDKLTTRAAGFGVVRFNKPRRTITLECWPRNVDVTDPGAQQYPGWPKTIRQTDNYGRKPAAYLPVLKISGMEDPVVQVIDESDGQIVYTLRIKGRRFRPKVFRKGKYTVKIGRQGARMKTLKGIEALAPHVQRELRVEF